MTFIRTWDESLPTELQNANQLCVIERQLEVDFRERLVVFPGNLVAPGSQKTPDSVFGNASGGVVQINSSKLHTRWNGSARVPVKAGWTSYALHTQTYTGYGSGPIVTLPRDIVFAAPGNYVLETWVFTSTPGGLGAVEGALFIGPNLGIPVNVSTVISAKPSFGYMQVHFTYATVGGVSTLTVVGTGTQNVVNFGSSAGLSVFFVVGEEPGVPWPSGFSFIVYGPFVRLWKVN